VKKYEFTGETKEFYGITLKRIRRISDGLIGGWIEKEDNLSQDDDAMVYDNAKVYGSAIVCGSAMVYDSAEVYDNARVYGSAIVCGSAKVYGSAKVGGRAMVYGSAEVVGSAKVFKYNQCINITNQQYNITITPQVIKIGCHYKSYEDWMVVGEKEAEELGLKRENYDKFRQILQLFYPGVYV
jgi:hypothetical protein